MRLPTEMIKPIKLGGAVVPLVTPITSGGQLDFAALDRLIESQISGGVEGLLILGTTGEGPCIPRTLRLRLLEHVVLTARGRLVIYAKISISPQTPLNPPPLVPWVRP